MLPYNVEQFDKEVAAIREKIEQCIGLPANVEALQATILYLIENKEPASLFQKYSTRDLSEFLFEAYEHNHLSLCGQTFKSSSNNSEDDTFTTHFAYQRDIDIMLPLFQQLSSQSLKDFDVVDFVFHWALYGDCEDFKVALDFATEKNLDFNYSLYQDLIWPIYETFLPNNSYIDYEIQLKKLDLLLNHYHKDFRFCEEQVWSPEAHDPLYYYEGYKDLVSRLQLFLIRTPYRTPSLENQDYTFFRENCVRAFWPHLTENEIQNWRTVLITNNSGLSQEGEPLLDAHMAAFVHSFYEQTLIEEQVGELQGIVKTKNALKI